MSTSDRVDINHLSSVRAQRRECFQPPVVPQHGIEIQKFGTMRLLPIALALVIAALALTQLTGSTLANAGASGLTGLALRSSISRSVSLPCQATRKRRATSSLLARDLEAAPALLDVPARAGQGSGGSAEALCR